MNLAKGLSLPIQWPVFNKQNAVTWLLCSAHLPLPPEIVHYIAKTMFYDSVPQFISSGFWFTRLQSRAAYDLFEKKSPLVICNWKPCYGKTSCAREIALHAMLYLQQSIFFVDTDLEKVHRNSNYMYRAVCANPCITVTRFNSETIVLENNVYCQYRPLSWHHCKTRKAETSMDILILFVKNDQHVDNIEFWISGTTYNQVLIFGNADQSDWFKEYCKRNWLHVIQ